ncbi:MAG: hypothetical protein ISQ34_01880 [Rickettsiales bacterium]|nr:hypothetical protein [Rickettsiales bacterium]
MKTNIKLILLFSTILLFANSCSSRVIDVKSPCVSTEDGPCGPKKPINNWWLGNTNNS